MHTHDVRKNSTVRRGRILMVLVLFIASAGLAIGEERIQLAILLDTSNSMDGLIGQAKSQLWKVVNELARARRNGKAREHKYSSCRWGDWLLRLR